MKINSNNENEMMVICMKMANNGVIRKCDDMAIWNDDECVIIMIVIT